VKAFARVEPRVYQRLELRAHALLAGVPLHDAWRVELPGGGAGRTVADVGPLLSASSLASLSPIVRALFGLRRWLGRVFRWDAPSGAIPDGAGPHSFLARLTEEDRRRSLVLPGSADGAFTVLYVHPGEALREIRNATVHAFLVQALEPTDSGYRLFFAVHVAPVGRITRLYLAAIDPFRRWLVYPALLRHVRREWCAARPPAGA